MGSIQVSDKNGDAEFAGFANDGVDKRGKRIDPRKVDRYVDETPEGKALLASQTTESSIVKHRTEGPSTNGAPAAQVPAPKEPASSESPAEGEGANGS